MQSSAGQIDPEMVPPSVQELRSGCMGPPVELDREDGTLGRITGYCPDRINPAPSCGPVADTERLNRLSSSYELRARLRSHAADARIAKCGSVVYTDPTLITDEMEDGSREARWSGIVLCNRAGCPVCGAAKAKRFRESVLRTLSSGGLWQHVILTVPHTPGEEWSEVYERLLNGVRASTKGLTGRVVMEEVDASIRATESTWSTRSGWHVHLHVLWKLRRPLLDEERAIMARQWSETTGAHPVHGCMFGLAFNCVLEQKRRQAASYISKIASEMSGCGKSAHPEHWTLGELYHRACEDETFVPLVQEYQMATKGRRLYQLDRRAQALHDTAPELPERVVVRSWITVVDRVEFRGLSQRERFGGDVLATYLPLEVAIRARGDPRDQIEDTIYGLLSASWNEKPP